MKPTFISMALACCLILTSCQNVPTATTSTGTTTTPIAPQITNSISTPAASPALEVNSLTTPICRTKVKKIIKGEVLLSCSYTKLKKKKIKHCDIVRVSTNSFSMDIPVCDKQTDVNLRNAYIRLEPASGRVYLSTNHGKFANMYYISKNTPVTLQCVEKNGYYEEYQAHQYIISDRRSDYKNDRVFANFREVRSDGIAPKTLYRSGNPLLYFQSPNRSNYCAKLVKKSKVKSIINMSNTKREIKSFIKRKPSSTSYYKKLWKKGNVYYGKFTTDMTSEEYMLPVISALRFMIDAPAPYVIHCNMGKDRTGYLCALLQALTGASYEEIVDDYMISFENYYGIKRDTRRWDLIAKGNIGTLLSETFVTDEFEKANLAWAATNYLKKYGMSDEEIEALKNRLAGE